MRRAIRWKYLIGLTITAMTLCMMAAPGYAQAPRLINYQGYLTDDGGNPIDGTVQMTFGLYTIPVGGSPVWDEVHPAVTVSAGLYSVTLGSIDMMSSSHFVQPLYLGIAVDPDGEMTPRQELTSVGYALNAAMLDGQTAADFASTGHGHAGDDIVVGTVPVAYGGTGAATPPDARLNLGAAAMSHVHAGADITTGTVADARIADSIARDDEVLPTLTANDGAGSGFDADLLDGEEGAFYRDASNINAGTLDAARLPSEAALLSQLTAEIAALRAELAMRTRGWGEASRLEDDPGAADYHPRVAGNPAGNAIAVWSQTDGARYNIWASRYDAAGDSWSTAELIETDNAGDAEVPWVAMDPSGNAIAVWEQRDAGGTRSIWSNRYDDAGASWGTPQLLESDNTGHAREPRVVMDGSGNAIAVWRQDDGTYRNVWSNRYDDAGATWGTAQLIETNDGHTNEPAVSIDAAGNAIAVWRQIDVTRNIWSNRYDFAGATWGTAVLIEANDDRDAYAPQVAMDPAGNAIAVWEQSTGAALSIWSNRYDFAGAAWGTPVLIETDDTGSAAAPQVAMDSDGNAIAVWEQVDAAVSRNIMTNRYNAAGSAWGTAELLETVDEGHAFSPQVAFDAAGHAVAVWEQQIGPDNECMAIRYNAASGSWQSASELGAYVDGDGGPPQLTVDAAGNAIAVWAQRIAGVDSIYAARF